MKSLKMKKLSLKYKMTNGARIESKEEVKETVMSIKENLEPVSHLKKGTLKNSEYHSQPYNICDLKKIMLIPPSTP